MASFLLTYASTHGQTAKIAGAIGDAMREAGADVVVRDVAEVSEEDAAEADAFVVGGPLYEYTDWDAVARFGRELTELVGSSGP